MRKYIGKSVGFGIRELCLKSNLDESERSSERSEKSVDVTWSRID